MKKYVKRIEDPRPEKIFRFYRNTFSVMELKIRWCWQTINKTITWIRDWENRSRCFLLTTMIYDTAISNQQLTNSRFRSKSEYSTGLSFVISPSRLPWWRALKTVKLSRFEYDLTRVWQLIGASVPPLVLNYLEVTAASNQS